MVQPFQDFSGDPFDDSCLKSAPNEKKDRIVYQFGQGQFHDDNGDSVDETEGAGGKSAVGKMSVFDRSDHRLDDPSDEGINEEQPEQLCKSILHRFSFVKFSFQILSDTPEHTCISVYKEYDNISVGRFV